MRFSDMKRIGLAVLVLGSLSVLPGSAVAAQASRSQVFRDGDGDALLVRAVRRSTAECDRDTARRGIEVRTREAGGRATAPKRLGSRCDAAYPSVAVAADGTALVSWRQSARVRVAEGSTASGVRDAGHISARGGSARPGPIAIDTDGRAVITYRRAAGFYAVSRTEAGRLSRAQRLGRGTGALLPALAPDGSAVVVWTTSGAGGEVGTSPPNRLLAARRASAGARFSDGEQVASGVLRDLVVAAGPSGVALAFTAEDVPNGGTSGVTFAPTGQPFEPLFAFETPTAVSVDLAGVARARNPSGSIRRVAPGTWSPE
jgi:hypothetical protein